MAERFKLTKLAVDKIPFSEKRKQKDYYDAELPAFGVRVSSTTKVYFIRKRINGKNSRVNLGKHGVITAAMARKDAKNALSDLDRGIDINQKKAQSRVKGVTLQATYEDYLRTKPQIKKTTITVDKSLLNCHLSDWLEKPIKDITEPMIRQRHLKTAKKSGENTANNVFRLFRRIYLFAWRDQKKAKTLDRDLVKDALDGRWFKVGRRTTIVREHELCTWYKAVQKINNPIIKDYLLLLVFTGLRKTEGLTLAWSDVDMKNKTFTIRKEKSKNNEPLLLPMGDAVYEIFKRRLHFRENGFVFPGIGRTGHLTEPQRQLNFIERETKKILNGVETDEELKKLIQELGKEKIKPGIRFCLHDLRRTFISIAEGEVSYSVLKKLVNHTDKDVTQGYIIMSVEKLRLPVQQVTNVIKTHLNKAGLQQGVVSFSSARKKRISG